MASHVARSQPLTKDPPRSLITRSTIERPPASEIRQYALTDTRRTLWACGVARAIAQNVDICCHTANTGGALGRIRTSDTRFRKPVLYPLSYEGRSAMLIRT